MHCHGSGKKADHGRKVGNGSATGEVRRGGGGRAGRLALLVVLLVAGLIFVGAVAKGTGGGWFGALFKQTPAEVARASGVEETADEVRIPLRSLDPGKAIFLQANLAGVEIHYFVLKSSDGVYRAAYDACDVCFRANRGYRQEGDLMVCNNCGQSFPSVKVNEVKGGCNPSPLARTVDGEHLLIRKADLAAGGPYFPGKRT